MDNKEIPVSQATKALFNEKLKECFESNVKKVAGFQLSRMALRQFLRNHVSLEDGVPVLTGIIEKPRFATDFDENVNDYLKHRDTIIESCDEKLAGIMVSINRIENDIATCEKEIRDSSAYLEESERNAKEVMDFSITNLLLGSMFMALPTALAAAIVVIVALFFVAVMGGVFGIDLVDELFWFLEGPFVYLVIVVPVIATLVAMAEMPKKVYDDPDARERAKTSMKEAMDRHEKLESDMNEAIAEYRNFISEQDTEMGDKYAATFNTIANAILDEIEKKPLESWYVLLRNIITQDVLVESFPKVPEEIMEDVLGNDYGNDHERIVHDFIDVVEKVVQRRKADFVREYVNRMIPEFHYGKLEQEYRIFPLM